MSLKGAKHWRESFDPRTGAALDVPETRFAFFYERGRAFPARRQADRLRPRGVRVRHRAAVAGGLAHRRDLSRRLDAAAPARDDHRFAGAGPEDGAAAFPDDRDRVARPDRAAACDDQLEPRPLARRDPAEHVRSIGSWRSACPPAARRSVTVATPAASAVYRDPTKAALSGHVDRPVGILLRIDRPRGRARTAGCAARREVGCTPTRAVSSVGRAPARQAGGHWFEPSTAHSGPSRRARTAWLSHSVRAIRAVCAVPGPDPQMSTLRNQGGSPCARPVMLAGVPVPDGAARRQALDGQSGLGDR